MTTNLSMWGQVSWQGPPSKDKQALAELIAIHGACSV